jgi:hypothetical protein
MEGRARRERECEDQFSQIDALAAKVALSKALFHDTADPGIGDLMRRVAASAKSWAGEAPSNAVRAGLRRMASELPKRSFL